LIEGDEHRRRCEIPSRGSEDPTWCRRELYSRERMLRLV
jgi:hypothetical protein